MSTIIGILIIGILCFIIYKQVVGIVNKVKSKKKNQPVEVAHDLIDINENDKEEM